jgi:hypothetical protein
MVLILPEVLLWLKNEMCRWSFGCPPDDEIAAMLAHTAFEHKKEKP